jgi:hypothetical protein
MTEAQALMDGVMLKIQEKYPDAIVKKIAPEKAMAVISKLKKLKNIVPRKADFNKIADQIQKQQPYFSRQQAEELAKLRIEAQISRSTSFNDMIDVLSKSDFYAGRLSTANIDKGRTRSLEKDASISSFTEADERKMTGRKFKRISKGGHKNQYGTTKGGNVYYEYRDNRRDVDSKIRLENGGMASQGRFKKRFSNGGKIEKGDNVNVIAENKSGVVMNVISNGKHFTIQFVDGTKKVYDKNEIRKIFDEYDEFSEGGGVKNFKYERGQKFEDQYGEIILLDKYSDTLWEARRWSGMRHVGDVVISEKDLDLIRTKKMAQGDLVHGRFSKHFKKGGATQKATYIPNKNIRALTTTYGNTIKGKDLLDGAYTTRKDIRQDPKMIRSIFEEEYFEEFGNGGLTKQQKDYLRKLGISEAEIKEADKREKAGRMSAINPKAPVTYYQGKLYENGGAVDSNVFNTIKKGDVIKISFKSAMSEGSVDLLVKSKTRVGKGKSWESEKITFINLANPKGVNFYAYMRNDSSVGFAIGDMAISDVKIISHS